MNKKQLQSIIREEVREVMNSTQPSTGNMLGSRISGMGPQAQKALAKLEGYLMDYGFFQSANPQEVKDLAQLVFNVCQAHYEERSNPSMKYK